MSFLHDYNADFIYLSLGGGVQSSTIAEMVAQRDLPAPDLILFADTGDEPQYVYDQIDYLKGRLKGISPVVTVSAGNMIHDIFHGSRFAAMPVFTKSRTDNKVGIMRRQCTREYKIDPIEKAVKSELLRRDMAHTDGRGTIVHQENHIMCWIGISLDEVQRMKPNRSTWCDTAWPLIDLRFSRLDCINYLQARNLPIPGKSSCRVCPFHDNAFWRAMKHNANADWKHVIGFDDALRDDNTLNIVSSAKGDLFLHRDCQPLKNVDLRTLEEKGQLRLFDDEETLCDEGYCFI